MILNRLALLGMICGTLLASCETGRRPLPSGISRAEVGRLESQRAAQIAREAPGNYYVGRRYRLERIRVWGFLREPGSPWSTARAVVMNESQVRVPDRLPEEPVSGPAWGYDHNYEYQVRGRFTGRKVYDPNADLEVDEFLLTGISLIDDDPGYLFNPGEVYNPYQFPLP